MARNSSRTQARKIVTESSSSCEDIKAGKNSFIKWTSNLTERFERDTASYRYFYVTGIALVRKAKRIRRRTLRFARAHVRSFISAPGTDAFWAVKASLDRAGEPIAEGFNWSLQFAEQMRKARETGEHRKLLSDTLRSGVKLCSDTPPPHSTMQRRWPD